MKTTSAIIRGARSIATCAIVIASLAIAVCGVAPTRAQSRITTPPPSGAPAQSTSQSITPAPPRLPSAADVDAALKRTLGYDPAISWQIISIQATAIPGITEVIFSVNKQGPQHIYLSADGKNAIIGEMLPFGLDPYAPARTLLFSADGPARGAETPAISIVEFSDLQCPHCKAAQPIFEKLLTDFPNVRFVFQQFPLPASVHPWAMKGADYSDCVGQISPDAFWKFVDNVFAAQTEITVPNADEKLKAIAITSGADGEKVAACSATPEADARVKKSLALGAALGVDQTPTTFINGRKVPGIANIPYEQLKNLVKFEIEHAGK
jgi:protein-disulfide isomerase